MGSGAPRPDEAEAGQHGQQRNEESSAWCNDKCRLEVTAEGGQLGGENIKDPSEALLDIEVPTASVYAANGDRPGSVQHGLEGGKEASGQPSGLAGHRLERVRCHRVSDHAPWWCADFVAAWWIRCDSSSSSCTWVEQEGKKLDVEILHWKASGWQGEIASGSKALTLEEVGNSAVATATAVQAPGKVVALEDLFQGEEETRPSSKVVALEDLGSRHEASQPRKVVALEDLGQREMPPQTKPASKVVALEDIGSDSPPRRARKVVALEDLADGQAVVRPSKVPTFKEPEPSGSQEASDESGESGELVSAADLEEEANNAARIKLLLDSWALANKVEDEADTQAKADSPEDEDSLEIADETQNQAPKKSRWAKMKDWGMQRSMEFKGRRSGEQASHSMEDADQDKEETVQNLLGSNVPATYGEMFEFNATVMGFGKHRWLREVNRSFHDIVKNAGNSSRLQEECEVLALRICKTVDGDVNLSMYRSAMLAALRSMLPKTWDPNHETVWNWLWESVESNLRQILYKPRAWEPALLRLMSLWSEEEKVALRNEVYVRFFQVAPQGQEFFKQSDTRLHFIATRAMDMTSELLADPWEMTEQISALGLRHVGYGIPTHLIGPFANAFVEVLCEAAPEEHEAMEAFRWSVVLVAKILVRVIEEGATIVMKAINANSALQLRKAVALAPRGERAQWLLRIQVGTQQISPLSWAIESGSLEAARAMIQDLLMIRADRERYYFGVDALFQAHPDIVERLCADALQLLPALLDGLVWRSKRAINGARRVNFYVKHLVVNKDGAFSAALKAIADAKDVKIISHQVVVQISDTLWSGVVRRQFTFSKISFLFSLVVFMLSQAILPKTETAEEFNMRIAIFSGRLINYAFSMARLLVFHLRRIVKAFRTGATMKVGRVPIPEYLKDEDAKLGFILLCMLVAMCASEPMFYCASDIMTTGPSETCEAANAVMPLYILFSMGAMVLHWLLVINLSVFATKLAAFVLVCREVLSEVGKFLVAIIFILITFSSAIATLRHEVAEFRTLPKAANCLFATTVGIYEGDYREMMHQPALLAPVLLFITVSAILLINLLIAQLNCSYDYVYGDMLGFARLARASLIVDSMAACPPARFSRFVAGLRFDQLLEFDEGDVRWAWAEASFVAEFLTCFDTMIDLDQGSPDMQWPEEELETDRYARIAWRDHTYAAPASYDLTGDHHEYCWAPIREHLSVLASQFQQLRPAQSTPKNAVVSTVAEVMELSSVNALVSEHVRAEYAASLAAYQWMLKGYRLESVSQDSRDCLKGGSAILRNAADVFVEPMEADAMSPTLSGHTGFRLRRSGDDLQIRYERTSVPTSDLAVLCNGSGEVGHGEAEEDAAKIYAEGTILGRLLFDAPGLKLIAAVGGWGGEGLVVAMGYDDVLLRVPLDLEVPNDVTLRTLQHLLSKQLEEAGLQALRPPSALFLALNGHLCVDPKAQPLRNLVPGSVVSLVEDMGEAQEVARLGLCLNAVQLLQVQYPTFSPPGQQGHQKKMPEEVLREKRQRLYKTQPCANYAAGHCTFGHKCHFAHGEHELRLPGKVEGSPSTSISSWNLERNDGSWEERSQWPESWKWGDAATSGWRRGEQEWQQDWQDGADWSWSASGWDGWSEARGWKREGWQSDWQDGQDGQWESDAGAGSDAGTVRNVGQAAVNASATTETKNLAEVRHLRFPHHWSVLNAAGIDAGVAGRASQSRAPELAERDFGQVSLSKTAPSAGDRPEVGLDEHSATGDMTRRAVHNPVGPSFATDSPTALEGSFAQRSAESMLEPSRALAGLYANGSLQHTVVIPAVQYVQHYAWTAPSAAAPAIPVVSAPSLPLAGAPAANVAHATVAVSLPKSIAPTAAAQAPPRSRLSLMDIFPGSLQRLLLNSTQVVCAPATPNMEFYGQGAAYVGQGRMQAMPQQVQAQLAAQQQPANDEDVARLVQDLQKGDERETALLELSKRRESLQDLAPILWHSFGTIVALIQEIVQIYPQLAQPPTLTATASNRVCNSLALLQCVASHPETRPLFLKAQIPLLLYPFLNTSSAERPFEYLRLTSLGVIGALVKVDDQDVIVFLLNTEIIPLCLRIMESGSELSKTVATFIVQKLLLDESAA
ncbi:cnot9, partial [Symbiodinium sp. CCMP2456]